MPITPTNPITVPAKTFDRLWVTLLSVRSEAVSAPDALPSPDASATIRLLPYSAETLDTAESQINVNIPNIFTRISQGDTKLAQILGLILEYAGEEAKRQGLI